MAITSDFVVNYLSLNRISAYLCVLTTKTEWTSNKLNLCLAIYSPVEEQTDNCFSNFVGLSS